MIETNLNPTDMSMAAMYAMMSKQCEITRQKEEAAKLLFAHLIHRCGLLAEIAKTRMDELMPQIKDYKWFKREVKQNMNTAYKMLSMNLAVSKRNSPNSQECLKQVFDMFHGLLKPDLFRLYNVIATYLGKEGVEDNMILSEIVVIETLLNWTGVIYDSALEKMVTIFGDESFYNSWYGLAAGKGVHSRWVKALNIICGYYSPEMVDLNEIPQIKAAINHMRYELRDESGYVQGELNRSFSEEMNDEVLKSALSVFGLGTDLNPLGANNTTQQ